MSQDLIKHCCSIVLSVKVNVFIPTAAEQATSEMNRKEKDIIRAYLRAVRYASHLESRVRIVLVGDTGTGESELESVCEVEMCKVFHFQVKIFLKPVKIIGLNGDMFIQ